jgi:hypothetical protein
MNPTLSALFPNASQDAADLNPQLSPVKPTKKRSTVIVRALRAHLRKNYGTKAANYGQVSDSEPQHHETPALGSPNAGETKSFCRTRIRFTGYRVRPLDPDNFAGSVKDLLDGLRYADLIGGDEPWRIILETEQEKVKSYADEKTVIEIEYP